MDSLLEPRAHALAAAPQGGISPAQVAGDDIQGRHHALDAAQRWIDSARRELREGGSLSTVDAFIEQAVTDLGGVAP
jgi:hypothetical protein